jgi:predicted nucleotidyltransferase component of viral defense system
VLTRHQITRRADADGVDASVVERDYVLAHIVAQLHRANMNDGGRLVFKGGTALRLVHIGQYRYSADLDFTVLDGSADAAVESVAEVLAAARDHAGFPHLGLTSGNKPGISFIGPLESSKPREAKLDIATDEYVEDIAQMGVLPVWDDLPEPVPFSVYPVSEIGAEKLRCVIQRVQCRDLYDLFRLVDELELSVGEIRPLFERKCEAKSIDPATFGDRFEDRQGRYKNRWDTEMPEHLSDPPRFDDVVRLVRRHLRAANLLARD